MLSNADQQSSLSNHLSNSWNNGRGNSRLVIMCTCTCVLCPLVFLYCQSKIDPTINRDNK